MYHDGDKIGPYDIILINRTEKMPSGAWKGVFLCPFHDKQNPHYFESDLNSVARGIKYHCGCQGRKEIKVQDLTGQKFGRLTVLKESRRINSSLAEKLDMAPGVYWLCQCSCEQHTIIEVSTSCLKSGGVSSCGCLKRESSQDNARKIGYNNRVDITGETSGTWTAIRRTELKSGSSFLWDCVCENGHHNFISTNNWGKIKFCKQCKNQHYSKGELAIQEVLENKSILFIKEYSFKDCRDKRPLRFDFYLPDYNICIEYDGIQHFTKTNFSRENLTTRQLHDKIKDEYCQANHIKLVRFNYTELDDMDDNYIFNKIMNREDD